MDSPILEPDVIKNLDNNKLDLYLDFSRSACVPGGGVNSEQALEMLYKSDGDVLKATLGLMHNDLNFPIWNHDEIKTFERLIELHGKNFLLISKDLKTKSVKQCVEFYYSWKRSPHRSLTRSSRNISSNNNITATATATTTTTASNTTTAPSNTNTNTTTANQNTTSYNLQSNLKNNTSHNSGANIKLEVPQIASTEIFPCKVCGRIFEKIKSRSAHMKRHKNEVSNFGYAYDH